MSEIVATRSLGAGSHALRVLQSIRNGRAYPDEIVRLMKPYIAGVALKRMLLNMERDGLVGRARGGRYTLTAAGGALVPVAGPAVTTQPYVPPVVQRRANSSWSHIPSRMGNELIPHWAAKTEVVNG